MGMYPEVPVTTPASTIGNFIQSTTSTILGSNKSPYLINTDGLQNTGAYSVLDAGPGNTAGTGSPVGSAIYNLGAPEVDLLWGSPDPYNEVAFFSDPGGTGTNLGSFNGADLACFKTSCNQTEFDLVTFAASSGNIGSVMLSNSLNDLGSAPAFAFGGPDPVPLPPAIYLFVSVIGGAFCLAAGSAAQLVGWFQHNGLIRRGATNEPTKSGLDEAR